MQRASAVPKPKRRWCQFSVRTSLLLTAVLAVWLGSYVDRARQWARAVQAVQKLGGVVVYHHEEAAGGHPPGPAWLPNPIGRQHFREYFLGVKTVSCNDNVGSLGAPLEHLQGLANLRLLGLGGC